MKHKIRVVALMLSLILCIVAFAVLYRPCPTRMAA